MCEWGIKPFGDLFSVIYRYPSYYGINYVDKGVPEIRGELLNNSGTIDHNYRFVSELTANNYNKVRLNTGDIVLSVRGTVGKIGVVTETEKGAVITANLIRLAPNKNNYTSWIKQLMMSDNFKHKLEKACSQTTISTIQVPNLKNIKVNVPPYAEQYKIANILSTVDNTIEKTEALIEKYQKVKEGMMQDLFTRGIGEDGKLRPPYHEAPELYKETELGMLPKEWVIKPISEHASVLVGYAFKSEDYCQDGIPLIRIGNLFNNQLDMNREPVYLPHTFKDKFNNYLLEPNDMIISMTGTLGKRDYGFVVRIPKKSNQIYLLNQRVGKFIISREYEMDRDFFFHLLHSNCYLDALYSKAGGTKQANLSPSQITSICVCWPTIDEQKRIVAVLNEVNEFISKQKLYLMKTNKLKQALMQDLLTGKVRVPA